MEYPENMSAAKKCHLLSLPRELRDNIYLWAGVSHELTPDPPDDMRLKLHNSLNLDLLCACKQIHDEYGEAWSEDLTMVIVIRDLVSFRSSGFDYLKSLPTQLVTNVKHCAIDLALSDLEDLDSVRNDPAQASRAMVLYLRQTLDQIAACIPSNVDVTLCLEAWGFELLEGVMKRLSLQASTFKDLESDDQLAFARNGKLHMCFGVETPLYLELESDNDNFGVRGSVDDMTQATSVTRTGYGTKLITRNYMSTYSVRMSDTAVYWWLRPLSDVERGNECNLLGCRIGAWEVGM